MRIIDIKHTGGSPAVNRKYMAIPMSSKVIQKSPQIFDISRNEFQNNSSI